jgi:hypothetical protein
LTTPVTGIDINVLINTLLGGIIAISGSLAVAGLYIWNQNKGERKRQLREMIQRDYFDNCINPTLGALAEYGMTTVFALADSSVWLGRSAQYPKEVTPQELEKKLQEISNRPLVSDLIGHKFTYVAKYRPLLQKFGAPLQNALIRTLQFYSSLVDDGTSYTVLKRTVESSSVDEVCRSLNAIAMIIERTLIFFEKRFIDLRDYFFTKELQTYDDFSKSLLKSDYTSFLKIFEEYKDGLTKLMDAMKGKGDRATASLSFSKWLDENMNKNPLSSHTTKKLKNKPETSNQPKEPK